MLVGEFLEIIGENTDGIDSVRGLLHAFQLDEETFPQVPGADSRRVELLYDMEHVQHFLISGRDVHPERKVVHDAVNVPAQVAVIIQAAYYECRHVVLVLAQVPESELIHKALRETLFYRKGVVLRFLVFSVIVYVQFVFRDGVVVLDVGQ